MLQIMHKSDLNQPASRITTNGMLFIISAFVFMLGGCQPKWDIRNPYENVDWTTHLQYKANLHTHTTRSDGRMNPQTVVDKYQAHGYAILAVTDHNEVTWPWQGFATLSPSNRTRERLAEGLLVPADTVYENRDPVEMGMLAIQANELSRHHHMGSYFNDHNGTTTEEESLEATAAKSGIITFMHPGRYKFGVDWYVDFYTRYAHLVGQEVYNQGDRYPNDRQLWDSILSVTMPQRSVWGFSNDDMHGESALGHNWNVFVLPEPTEEWVRKGMTEGRFYYVYAPEGHEGPVPPSINGVMVNQKKGVIEITATGYDSIRWISEGQTVARGNKIQLKDHPDLMRYVRAELYGQGETIAGTQPFGLKGQTKD
jgi:hypothetical protein